MVKEEEIMAEAGGGRGGYVDILGLGDDAMADYFLCLSPPSSYVSSAAVSTTTTSATAFSPTCASYLAPPPPYQYHHVLSFGGQAEQQYRGGGDVFGFHCYGGDPAAMIPVAVPQRSSPTTECSCSISSMSSSPTAISSSRPQKASKKKGSRGADQRKTASAAATNKRPRVRRERLGERILALQQLVSPFGKSDTASVLHEALGYIRFLHDQVQVLSSPYMQRLPPSARAAPVVAEPRAPSDLRSRGLCLVPIACTDHVAGDGSGADDVWSTVTAALSTAMEENGEDAAAAMVRGGRPGQLA